MDSCVRSLLALKMSKPLFVILQYLDEIFVQLVDLSQRFGGTRFDLMAPTNEWSGYFGAEMP
jgi:hypothetical protein